MPAPEPRGRSPWRDIGLILNLGFVFTAAVAIGLLSGWWLDSKLGTKVLFTLLGTAIGFYAGFREILRELKRLNGE